MEETVTASRPSPVAGGPGPNIAHSWFAAVEGGDKTRVLELLQSGVSIEMPRHKLADSRERGVGGLTCVGYTGLIMASVFGQTEMLDLLIDKCADMNAVGSDGCTALCLAAYLGKTDCARLLIRRGANVNKCDKDGDCATHNSCTSMINGRPRDSFNRQESFEVLKCLVLAGADIGAQNKKGLTVLNKCKAMNLTEFVSFLEEDAEKMTKQRLAKVEAQANQADVSKADEKDGAQPHIMISYNWGHQERVKQLVAGLRQVPAASTFAVAGFKIWLDVEQMEGSTLEAMANAVEGAVVVLLCLSSGYQNSPNCRLEGEYTLQQRKPYIPLMMESGWKPSGWLGMMLGAKLYYDLSGDTGIPLELLATLKKNFPPRLNASSPSSIQRSPSVSVQPAPSQSPRAAAASPPNQQPSPDVIGWSCEKVSQWLEEKKLPSLISPFQQQRADGRTLLALKALRSEGFPILLSTLQALCAKSSEEKTLMMGTWLALYTELNVL